MIVQIEDQGQDFTSFVLDSKNVIVETKPFQGWVWNGAKILNRRIKPGCRLKLVGPRDKIVRELRYPVISVSLG